MQTYQRPFGSGGVFASAATRMLKVSKSCQRGVLVMASIGLCIPCGWRALVVADQPERINRLGRVLGRGYGDGYHTCQSTGVRLMADLPAQTYTSHRSVMQGSTADRSHQVAGGFVTYYDHFDQACDAHQGCDNHGVLGQPLVLPYVMPEPVTPPVMTPPAIAPEMIAPEMMVEAMVNDETVMAKPLPSSMPNRLDLPGIMNVDSAFDPIAEAQRELEEQARELEEQRKMLAEQERYRQFQVFEKLRENKTERQRDDLAPTGDLGPADESTPIEESRPSELETKKRDVSPVPSLSDPQDLSAYFGAGVHQNPYMAPSSPSFPEVLPRHQASTGRLPKVQSTETQSASEVAKEAGKPARSNHMLDERGQTGARQSTLILQPGNEDLATPSVEPEQRIASREWLIIRQPK